MERFSESLDKVIAQYQKYEGKGRPMTHVVIFQDDDGSYQQRFIYETQIPGVVAHAQWKRPKKLGIHAIDPTPIFFCKKEDEHDE